jgi:microcystin-dependent protein
MPALQFILTTAGKNAIVNANNTGTNPITITKIGIGSASWTPTAAATSLNTEIKKITAIGGGAVANDTIHVTANDSSTDAYTVREIGLFTADNILVAVYSQASAIITKGAATVALIATDLVITGVPAGSVTVGDTTFDYPQATETVKGVAEIATDAEVTAGTDNERIVTPAKLAARYVKKSGDTMTGALTLPGDPSANLHATTKEYVDRRTAGDTVPIGTVAYFSAATAPDSWLVCNGQAISRTEYDVLFARIGTTYGAGNGSTTFNVPDLRGEFIRGWDGGRGVDSGRTFGSAQVDELKSHTHSIDPPSTTTSSSGDHSHVIDPPSVTTTSDGNHAHTFDYRGDSSSNGANIQSGSSGANSGTKTTSTNGAHTHTVDIGAFNSATTGAHTHTFDIALFNSGATGGTETRPRNVALLPCIKAKTLSQVDAALLGEAAQIYVRKAGDTMTGTITGPGYIGNSSTASALQAARTIALGGDVTGSASFNGSGNITITATVNSASTTVEGKVELATSAETIAGTDAARAVTPAGLAAVVATTAQAGLVELATTTETTTGTDTARAVTPNAMRLHPGVARAWVLFDGSGTVAVNNSHNVSSITDRGVGQYTANFTAAFGSSAYAMVGSARQINNADDSCTVSPRLSEAKSTAGYQFSVTEGSNLQDSSEIALSFFA